MESHFHFNASQELLLHRSKSGRARQGGQSTHPPSLVLNAKQLLKTNKIPRLHQLFLTVFWDLGTWQLYFCKQRTSQDQRQWPRWGSCYLEGTGENIVSLIRSHWFAHQVNHFFSYQASLTFNCFHPPCLKLQQFLWLPKAARYCFEFIQVHEKINECLPS